MKLKEDIEKENKLKQYMNNLLQTYVQRAITSKKTNIIIVDNSINNPEQLDEIRNIVFNYPKESIEIIKNMVLNSVMENFQGNLDAVCMSNSKNIQALFSSVEHIKNYLDIDLYAYGLQDDLDKIINTNTNKLEKENKPANKEYKKNAKKKTDEIKKQWKECTEKKDISNLKKSKYTGMKNKASYEKDDYKNLLEESFIYRDSLKSPKHISKEEANRLSKGFSKENKVKSMIEFYKSMIDKIIKNEGKDFHLKDVNEFIKENYDKNLLNNPKFKLEIKNYLLTKYLENSKNMKNKYSSKTEFYEEFKSMLGKSKKLPDNEFQLNQMIKENIKKAKLKEEQEKKSTKLVDNIYEDIGIEIPNDIKKEYTKLDKISTGPHKAYGIYEEMPKQRQEYYDKLMKKQIDFSKFTKDEIVCLRNTYRKEVENIQQAVKGDKRKITNEQAKILALYVKVNNKYQKILKEEDKHQTTDDSLEQDMIEKLQQKNSSRR